MKFISTTIQEYILEENLKNLKLIDSILDRINKVGLHNLSHDEKEYLSL
jgi:hypothetical protein